MMYTARSEPGRVDLGKDRKEGSWSAQAWVAGGTSRGMGVPVERLVGSTPQISSPAPGTARFQALRSTHRHHLPCCLCATLGASARSRYHGCPGKTLSPVDSALAKLACGPGLELGLESQV